MDPPQAPLSAATTMLLNSHCPDSVDSSPRCRPVPEAWLDDHPLLPPVPGAKLRLMISYGGHIMPRPHDKSLSYMGGDTRMVAVDRHTSLRDLCTRLSRTLLHGRPFTLKYQLPNEELDNLISVTTDEDLDNMIEEYDRLSSKPSSSSSSCSPSRLRVFLFFSKPDTALSMGSLLDDAKSETWFVDALNNSGILSRVVSDSAAVDECLVNLDDGVPVASASGGSSNDLEGNAVAVCDGEKKGNKHLGEVHSVTGSMANVGAIRVGVEENGGSRIQQAMEMQDDATASAVTLLSAAAAEDHQYRKPPLPLHLFTPRTVTAPQHFGLPSPDSVASDSSITSANSYSRAVYYQEQQQDSKAPPLLNAKNSETMCDQSHGLQLQLQLQDSAYPLPQQQQQYVYIHHHHHPSSGQVSMSPYFPPSIGQQQQQQYPLYDYVIPTQPQPYNMTLQPNSVVVASSTRPLIPQSAASFKDVATPPVYPTNLPDVPPNVYKAPVALASTLAPFLQIPPPNQFQQQYVAMPQTIHLPAQPTAIAPSPTTTTTTTNYGYDYGGPPQQDHLYYTQHQSMTPAAAALSDASKQYPLDNIQQPSRTTTQPV